MYRIQSVNRQKRKGYKKLTPQHISENLLHRDFKATKPNEKWYKILQNSNMELEKKHI